MNKKLYLLILFWEIPFYIYPYDLYSLRTVPGTRYTSFEGFSVPRDFFNSSEYKEDSVPDSFNHQRTLYWNPDVKMNEKGEASIYFYNNSNCSEIDISAEGMTITGIPVVGK
ncbi:MAG: hypothetical protein LBH12_03270 [Dysgonamonadaceae bacterium]|jgi:hypothetical protein|nr:hypothetical protein [Dysgonamonadaceae bacterium]